MFSLQLQKIFKFLILILYYKEMEFRVFKKLKLRRKQNPANQLFTGLKVESPRIELGSKQATKRLSTRLFPD